MIPNSIDPLGLIGLMQLPGRQRTIPAVRSAYFRPIMDQCQFGQPALSNHTNTLLLTYSRSSKTV
jgi:hypothetical protein